MTDDCRHRIDHGYGCAVGHPRPRGGCDVPETNFGNMPAGHPRARAARVYDPVPDRGLKLYLATMAGISVAIMTTIGVTAMLFSGGWRAWH